MPCQCIWCIVLVLLDVVGSVCGTLHCRMRAVVYYLLLSQHVSGIIMPIFRRTKALLLHLVYCSGSAGCGCQRLWEAALQDASSCLLLTSVSTCFGHHYAHLQENKCPVTTFGVLFWFCWMWLEAVVGRCVVGCEQLFIINFCLNMFHATLCPSSGE